MVGENAVQASRAQLCRDEENRTFMLICLRSYAVKIKIVPDWEHFWGLLPDTHLIGETSLEPDNVGRVNIISLSTSGHGKGYKNDGLCDAFTLRGVAITSYLHISFTNALALALLSPFLYLQSPVFTPSPVTIAFISVIPSIPALIMHFTSSTLTALLWPFATAAMPLVRRQSPAPLSQEVITLAGGGVPSGTLPRCVSQKALKSFQAANWLENMESFFFQAGHRNLTGWGTGRYPANTLEVVGTVAAVSNFSEDSVQLSPEYGYSHSISKSKPM